MAVDDPGVARRDRNIGQERGHQPRPDRGAVDGRYDRLGAVDHVVDEIPRLLQRLPALLGILDDLFDHLEVAARRERSEEHTSELQSLMRISYAVFCLKKKTTKQKNYTKTNKQTLSNT